MMHMKSAFSSLSAWFSVSMHSRENESFCATSPSEYASSMSKMPPLATSIILRVLMAVWPR